VEASRDPNGQYLKSYYLEPASEKVTIPDLLMHSYNKFTFYGKLVRESGFPVNRKFQDPKPTPGPVFKYWSYRIKKPYQFWGPLYKAVDGSDTVELTSEIQVRSEDSPVVY
jgi:hypothetical protein